MSTGVFHDHYAPSLTRAHCTFHQLTACVCSDGYDDCQGLGTCKDVCSLPDTINLMAEANAQATCAPGSSTCGTGYSCIAAPEDCVTYTCAAAVGLSATACPGVCAPDASSLKMASAMFMDDGSTVEVVLSAKAVSGYFVCRCVVGMARQMGKSMQNWEWVHHA